MKDKKNIVIASLLVLLLLSGIVVGMNWNAWFNGDKHATAEVDTNAEEWTGDKETYTGKKNTDTIDIPGYGSINLKAGTKEQAVNLYNPPQNTCYFKMTLLLSDGTRLWESKLIAPGKAVYSITMQQALKAGAYEDATLKYECFTMDEARSPLNGSEIKLTLHVRE